MTTDLEKFEEKTISRKDVFNGRIIDVKVDQVKLPGNLGEGQRELIFHPGGVGVLAVTPENKMIMVRQYRKAIEDIIYEVPAGKLEPGEKNDLTEAILRELEEETGYTTGRDQIELISEFFVSPGISNEKTYLFFTHDLQKVEHPRAQDPDEVLELHEVTLEEAQILIDEGQIADAKTVIAVQYFEMYLLKEQMKLFTKQLGQ